MRAAPPDALKREFRQPGSFRRREMRICGDISTAEAIYKAAMQGDKIAIAVFEETGRYLGMACANLMNLLNPEAIVIGGGVMASSDLLFAAADEEVRRRAFAPSAARTVR